MNELVNVVESAVVMDPAVTTNLADVNQSEHGGGLIWQIRHAGRTTTDLRVGLDLRPSSAKSSPRRPTSDYVSVRVGK